MKRNNKIKQEALNTHNKMKIKTTKPHRTANNNDNNDKTKTDNSNKPFQKSKQQPEAKANKSKMVRIATSFYSETSNMC